MPVANNLMDYCQKHMGFKNRPSIEFHTDDQNAKKLLGKTAYYSPDEKKIVIFTSNRHPKDILRSLAHELVHHNQNCNGMFNKPSSNDINYAQKDPHLRNMEKEAYLLGNMLFRDWEDGIKVNIKAQLKENLRMNENKLKEIIKNELLEAIKNGEEIDEGLLDRIKARAGGLGAGLKTRAGNVGKIAKGVGKAVGGDKRALGQAGRSVEDPRAAKTQAMVRQKSSTVAKQIGKLYADLVNDMKKLGIENDRTLRKVIQGLNIAQKGLFSVAKDGLQDKLAKKGRATQGTRTALGRISEEELEEGGAAQRQGNEDRLRRQEPDRVKEAYDHIPGAAELRAKIKAAKEKGDMETVKKLTKRMQDVEDYYLGVREEQDIEEVDIRGKVAGKTAAEKNPQELGKPVKPKKPKQKLKEGSMKKTSRFKEGDKVKHKEDKDLGTGTVVSRKGNTVQVKWSSGQRSSDHNMLSKVNETNQEDLRIPENADALNEALYGNRRAALNKRLMEWAKK
tara:strand:- start:8059 stop:9579 length:1521 start_codon:yes stop_codon:yes gene_type:complete